MPVEALAGVGLASAAVLEIFGVPLQPIVWGLIGSVLGAGWAPAAKRWWGAIGVYLSASLISALAGHFTAAQWLGASPLAGNAIAAAIAIFFHPLLAAGAQRAPAFLDWLGSLLPFGRRGNP
ncbi:MAG: hypothetical protein EBR82_09630 [Caulobacteraceae bacterium]|nr:hypothetical protein [Caulobacteraceae bacterium]